MRWLAGVALVVLWAVAAIAEPADRASDIIVAREAIRARGRDHGEVRLVRRGDAAVVQTLLVTRSLKRAAARIRDVEQANWPEDSRGYGPSRRYLQALADAVAEVLEAPRSDRHRRLLIEIELSENAGSIALAKPSTRAGADGITLVTSEPITRLEVPCSWARRELALVADDRGLDLQKLAPLPGCAGPGSAL